MAKRRPETAPERRALVQPRPDDEVLIRWDRPGALIVEGRAYPRRPGDEDVVPLRAVLGSVLSGKVRVLSRAPERAIPAVLEGPSDERCES